jgi:hypothetical protein
MGRRVALGLLVFVVVASSAAAQDAWQQHTTAGEWAFRQGDMARAESEFRAALEIAQELPPGSRRLEQSLSDLARLYEHDGRTAQAQSKYLLLLAVQEHQFGLSDPMLLDTLLSVARTSQSVGDVPQAEASLRRYLEIAEESGVADAGQRWRVLAMLARSASLQERHDEALGLQRSAIASLAEDHDAGALERAIQLESLAQMEMLHGRPAAAEELLDEAVAARQVGEIGGAAPVLAAAAATALGAAEPDLAERLALAAEVASGDGAPPPEVEQVLAEVAWMRVQRGSDGFAELLAVTGDEAALAEAETRLVGLLRRQDQELAGDDPARVETLSRLAQVAAMRHDLEAAIDWQEQVSAALTGADVERSLRAEDGLAFLLSEAGRSEQALAVNTELLGRLEAEWGSGDPRLLPVLERQAGLLAEVGRRKDAKAVRKRIRALGA